MMFSHERLFVLDSYKKEIKYYSDIPGLPIKDGKDIGEGAKEVVQLRNVGKFMVRGTKRGIGELQFSWIKDGEMKGWKIKMANNIMAKEFAALVEEVRTGKPS